MAAAKYKEEFFRELGRLNKKKRLATEEAKRDFVARWDWNRMTEQDSEVWDMIFAVLDA